MKMTIRFASLVAAFAFGSTLVACSSSNVKLTPPPTFSPSPTPSPTATPSAVRYTAIGASDAVGYGASVPCANPPTVAVPTCPGGTGYVPDLARLLTNAGSVVTLNDLGISGAVLGPDILSTVNMYGALGSPDQCTPRTAGVDAYPADFITAELPHLTGTETLVTVFAGGNDTNGIANAAGCMAAASATTQQIDAFVSSEIAAFGEDLATLLGSVRAKAPNAKIYVANLPNFALIPVGQEQSLAAQQLLTAISVGIDLQVIDPLAASGTPVIDLLCNPQSYVPANFYTDGFHPDDAGYAAFAAAFDAQITATTPAAPSSTCSYIPTSNLKIRTLPSSAFPDFTRGKT
jgi:lysophospholipase L1-like esterase